MKKMKIVALVAATAMLVTSFSFQIANAANSPMAETNPVKFDENNIVLKFGALSDIHQDGRVGSDPEQKFRKAIDMLNEKTGNDLDAIFVAGDLTDRGSKAEVEQFKKVFTEHKKGNTELIYALGNHDSVNASNAKLFYETFGEEFFTKDLDKEQIQKGNRHVELNGIHFITLEPSSYGEDVAYLQASKTWLKNVLTEITTKTPNAPIFMATHPMINNTTFGSTLPGSSPGWSTKQLDNILNEFPQVYVFTGHLHYPLNDERSIMQKGFTTLGCGSVSYMGMDNGYTDTGDNTVPYDAYAYSQGNLIEVDKTGNVRIRRMDFYNNREIKEPWIIPAPNAEKTQLKYYSLTRKDLNKSPTFNQGSTLSVETTNDRMIRAKVGTASDDDMVHHYEAVITKEGDKEPTKVIKTLSGYYRAVMPSEFVFEFKNLTLGDTYKIEVFAVDSWGAKSAPLTQIAKVPDSPLNEELLKPDIFNFTIDNNNKITDSSPLKLAVETGKNTSVLKDPRVDIQGIKLNSNTDSAVRVVVPTDKTATLMDNFTIDVFFKTGTKSDSRQAIFSNQATGGYGLVIEPGTNKLTFNTMINNRKLTISSKEELKENEYYHAVATYDGNEILLYLDDVMQERMSVMGKVFAPRGEKHYFVVGASPNRDGGLENPFGGSVYKARVFTYQLDATHVRALSVPDVKPAPDFIKGDVNSDGEVKTVDALLILRHIAKIITLDGNGALAADFDGNGKITPVDALLILRKVAGL